MMGPFQFLLVTHLCTWPLPHESLLSALYQLRLSVAVSCWEPPCLVSEAVTPHG